MGRTKLLVGSILLIVVLVGGAVALGVVGAPAVGEVQNRFVGVDEDTTTIQTDIVVENPNPIGIQLGGLRINYTVDLNGVRLANGTKEGVTVSTGNSTLTVRTTMANERIPDWWVAHIRDGERSELAVHADVTSSTLGQSASFDPVDRTIETDLLSSFTSEETRPVDANQPLVSDPVLYINETRASWGRVSAAETPMAMAITLYNPKAAPYTITEIGYEITMNEIEVGAGRSDEPTTIPPKSTETVETTTVIDNPTLDEWWVSHLERNQVTQLRIDFSARVELPGGQTVRVPLDALTYEETIETDIFGTKAQSPTGGGADGGDGGTTESEQTATADGGSTTTTTASPTPTETTSTTEETTSETTTTDETTTTAEETTTTTTEDDDGLLP